ncbi:MAG: MFS transporter [Microbacteriaceae bacterium]|nr:MFS transporter [Microbacteriaceae bacterium]
MSRLVPQRARSVVRSRLLPSLGVVSASLFLVYGGVLSVLLPAQVEQIDPDRKVEGLALVTSVAFVCTMLAQPLVGALSDRTRSRLGRRAPWMIAGAVAGGGLLLGLAGVGSILGLCVAWAMIQFALNGTDVATSAFLVDAIPRERRGRAATVIAGAGVAGAAGGAVIGGALASERSVAYALLGIVVIAAVAGFVALNREPSTLGAARDAFSWRAFLRAFWIDPRRHPDFAWAFASRLAFMVSYQAVYGYLLYTAKDYIGLPSGEATRLVGLLTVVGIVSVLVAAAVVGPLSDRVGRRRPFVLAACLGLAGAMAIPLVSPTVPGMFALSVLLGLASGLYLSSGVALISEVLPGDGAAAAKDLGIYNVATNAGQVLGPLAAAVVIGALGYPGLFGLAIAGALLAAVLLLPIRGVR